MKNKINLQLFYLLPLFILSACTKDDNQPMPQSTVSRLYVSNADTDAAVVNTVIFDPADQNVFTNPYKFDSKLPDGNGILFNPFSGTVFQVSRRSKNIKTFRVNTDGSLANANSFVDEGLLSAREMAYDRSRDVLYVSSNIDSAIYVYTKASTLTGTINAFKKFKLNGQPWGIHLDNNQLFVAINLDRKEVQLFENVSELAVGNVIPTKKITINGALNLRGITYSANRDILLLTDIGEASASGFDTDGAIHIIKNAVTEFTANGKLITPAATIKGLNTNLGNPVDIAFDDRMTKDLIYVAEKAGRKILSFKFTDNGNAKPFSSYSLSSSPEAIYLDAR
jgi:glutamine cyclotransferase